MIKVTHLIGILHKVLPINHKNYNFREKKSSQVMKERDNLHLNYNLQRRCKHPKATAPQFAIGAKNAKAGMCIHAHNYKL